MEEEETEKERASERGKREIENPRESMTGKRKRAVEKTLISEDMTGRRHMQDNEVGIVFGKL